MIGKREIRLALTGSVLFLILGAAQGCSSDQVTGPGKMRAQFEEVTDTTRPVCPLVNGIPKCT